MTRKFPEHDKLVPISDKSQTCGEFVDWLSQEKGIVLAMFHEHGPGCAEGCIDRRLHPLHSSLPDLLAEFFGIDRRKLEAEKRQMIEDCRRGTGERR